MRLWTIHPRYLDPQGLVACWREALLAQKVLSGGTRGYRNHPQLVRFRSAPDPMSAIGAFLHEIAREAARRGYKFDVQKIAQPSCGDKICETRGQLHYEWLHLKRKLQVRTPQSAIRLCEITKPLANPLFRIVAGEVRDWEKQINSSRAPFAPTPLRKNPSHAVNTLRLRRGPGGESLPPHAQ